MSLRESIAAVFEKLGAKTWVKMTLIVCMIALYAAWGISVIMRDKQGDFNLYYIAAYGFAHGEDIYGANEQVWARIAEATGIRNYAPPYRYPPLTVLLVWPLTFIPPVPAAALWLLATGIAFIFSVWLLGRSFGSPWGFALCLFLAMGYVPLLTTMNVGQVNGLVLLSVCLCLWGLLKKKKGSSSLLASGLGAATGTMLKLVPFVHLLYILWIRRWREFVVGLIALLVFFALSIPLVGLDGLVSYGSHFFSLGESGNLVSVGANQSLNGFFSRTLLGVLSPEIIKKLILVASCFLVIASVGLCWPQNYGKDLTKYEFALITVAVNLITPYAWYHQFSLLLIPIVILAHHILTKPREGWMLIPLGLGYAALDIHGLFWHSFEGKPFLVSMPLYAALMIWAFLASILIREKNEGRKGSIQAEASSSS